MEGRENHPWRKILLVISCIILCIGTSAGPLVMRLYFVKGGKRIWFSSWLITGGWPVIFIPLLISYYNRKKTPTTPGATTGTTSTKLIFMNRRVFLATASIGVLTALNDYMSAYGGARLPVTTSGLIIASQLAFTAFFAFLLVKQKFTSYSINAIFLLTLSSVVLAFHTNGDRPDGETNKMYILGFVMTVGAAVLYGLILPMVELMYRKAKQRITYTLVLEIQLVLCFFATAFCTVAMLINKDFQAIPREAREYELGESRYYHVLVWSALAWQCYFLGTIGVIFCASSLLCGILISIFLPVTEILAVIIFHEKFSPEKGISLVLSLWGFVSYFYGEIKHNKKAQHVADDSQDNTNNNNNNNNNHKQVQENEMTLVLEP